MKYIITILILTSIALGINHHISQRVVAMRHWDETLTQATTPVIGYFGNGCTEVYMGEADRIIEGLKYDLRRELYYHIENNKKE